MWRITVSFGKDNSPLIYDELEKFYDVMDVMDGYAETYNDSADVISILIERKTPDENPDSHW